MLRIAAAVMLGILGAWLLMYLLPFLALGAWLLLRLLAETGKAVVSSIAKTARFAIAHRKLLAVDALASCAAALLLIHYQGAEWFFLAMALFAVLFVCIGLLALAFLETFAPHTAAAVSGIIKQIEYRPEK